MQTFDELLDDIMKLDHDDRSMLTDILNKRRIEEERSILKNYADSMRDMYHAGDLKSSSAQEAIDELHQFADSDDE